MDIGGFGSLSPNVEDRRDDGFLANWGGALQADLLKRGISMDDLKLMLQHPMTPWSELQAGKPLDDSATPLGTQAGMLDIVPGHQMWLARRKLGELLALQADPDTHSFTESIEPNSPPVRLDRRKR